MEVIESDGKEKMNFQLLWLEVFEQEKPPPHLGSGN